MANTTVQNGNFIEITPDGITDWSALDDLGYRVKISNIQFNPYAVDDELIVRNDGVDAAAMFKAKSIVAGQPLNRDYTPAKWSNPTIDADDCTFDTAANVTIMMEIE